jgi:bacillithiol biosynthesis cysteine-adding enzyme BshC
MGKFIEYNLLPGMSRIYYNYLNNFANVSEFYSADFPPKVDQPPTPSGRLWQQTDKDLSEFEKIIYRGRKRHNIFCKIVDILVEQNINFKSGKKSIGNAKLLKNENCFAVVTGQQVGLFTGPLYTIYKTITAIKLAENLKRVFPKYDFIPVFWMELEDHDFDEVNNFTILNSKNELETIKYEIQHKPRRIPTGKIKIGNEIKRVFEKLNTAFVENDFKKSVIELLERCYRENSNFGIAFAEIMAVFFDDVVFLDPSDFRLKEIAKPIFNKIIHQHEIISNILTNRNKKLIESGYHLQIDTDSNFINLFYYKNNERNPILFENGNFSVRYADRIFSASELSEEVEKHPENFIPNVLIRPVIQDYLLPTVAYIAGPSEIAYFAQVSSIYPVFEIEMPIVYPRQSITIVENKIKKNMDKYNLSIVDIFEQKNKLLEKIVKSHSSLQIDKLFDKAEKDLENIMVELEKEISRVEENLIDVKNNAMEKVKYQLNNLKIKTLNAEKKNNEIMVNQISKVSDSIFPNGRLQERGLNIIYFLMKYGLDFIEIIKEKSVLDENFKHQIIEL